MRTGARYPRTIGAEAACPHLSAMPFQRTDLLAILHIPHFERLVTASRDDARTARIKRRRPDRALVTNKLLQQAEGQNACQTKHSKTQAINRM